MSDNKGAALMIDAFPKAKVLLCDRGYDADRFRRTLIERGIALCILSKSNRIIPIQHGYTLYRLQHCIENMFGKIKEWRRIMAASQQSARRRLTDSTGCTKRKNPFALARY